MPIDYKSHRVRLVFTLDLLYLTPAVTPHTAYPQDGAAGTSFTLCPELHSGEEASSQFPISWFITTFTQVSLPRAQIQGKVILFGTLPKIY